ncbi:MAG: CBS domain-containing protein [Actinomycetota bacterium]|nr:CBS domain-containing protein [Actinomycetota bacterium]MDI6821802.1 CBS domain-containing protein [Actinomycetota bacterium]
MWLGDMMTRRVVSIGPDSPVIEAAKRMGEENVGCLIVLEDGKLVGMLTDRDIATRVVGEGVDPKDCKVRDCMTREIVTAIPQTDILDAAKLMTKYEVRRLPIVDGQRVVGIVSIADIAAYAESILGEVSKSRKR